MEVPQIQYEDQVVQVVPVAKHVHVPMVQTVQKTVEVPQVELLVINVKLTQLLFWSYGRIYSS